MLELRFDSPIILPLIFTSVVKSIDDFATFKTKNKLLILAVNRQPVRKGGKIASDKSAFL